MRKVFLQKLGALPSKKCHPVFRAREGWAGRIQRCPTCGETIPLKVRKGGKLEVDMAAYAAGTQSTG